VGGHAAAVVRQNEFDVREVVILELAQKMRRQAPRAYGNALLHQHLIEMKR
jgi:hypothetical protein